MKLLLLIFPGIFFILNKSRYIRSRQSRTHKIVIFKTNQEVHKVVCYAV